MSAESTCLELPLRREHLKKIFLDGFKHPSDLKMGVEWEKIGVYRDSGQAIRYSGPQGVEAIFHALVNFYHWDPVFSDSHIIALKKNQTGITLEPGGQIELSGWKTASLDQNAEELYSHLDEIKAVSEPLGIVWLGIGAQPFSIAGEIEWVPKKRYIIMKESLKDKGELTYSMMKETASVQISLDYTSEEDAILKLRLAMGLSPLLTALFANSPVAQGKLTKFYSRRAHIWSQTAPERSGIIPGVFEPDFSFEKYIDFALKVPILFITRQGEWLPLPQMPFNDFLENGWNQHRATFLDWELHLTSIFTESRLKSYLEIRSIDCQQRELGLAAAAFLKGLFYDERCLQKAWQLVADISWKERLRLSEESPQKGLETLLKGKPLRNLAETLLELSKDGLQQLALKKLAGANEERYLIPLEKLFIMKGQSPAERLIQELKPYLGGKDCVKKVIELTAI